MEEPNNDNIVIILVSVQFQVMSSDKLTLLLLISTASCGCPNAFWRNRM